MFTHYRTQGFILSETDRGEADKIFTIFTKDFGRLELLAKAGRKIKSKLRGALGLFYLSEVEFIQGKSHKTLTDAILINRFSVLRKDLKRLSVAKKISEAFLLLVRGQEPDEKIWRLLDDTLEKLNSNNLKPITYNKQNARYIGRNVVRYNLIYYYFLWNILSVLGYELELYGCVFCQKKLIPKGLFFSSGDGGIVCGNCEGKLKNKELILPETIKIIRIIMEKNWKTLEKLKIKEEEMDNLLQISESYLLRVSE